MSETIKNTERNTVAQEKPLTVVQEEGLKPVTVVDKKPVTVVQEEPVKPVTVVDKKPVTIVQEEKPVTVVQEEPVTVVQEEPVTVVQEEKPVTFVQEEPVKPVTFVQEEPVTVIEEGIKGTSEEITLTIDKSTLVSLCQNLNTNLLVNIAAYKSVLAKLKDSEKDEIKVSELDSNITKLNELEGSVSELLNTVQSSLDIPKDKQIDPETVIQEASTSGSSGFMQKLLGAEAAAILGSMTAATVLMLGGAKLEGAKLGSAKRRKITKRRRNKGRKITKRHENK